MAHGRRMKTVLPATVLTLAAGPTAAAELRCWYEQGVLVAPAAVGPVAGDFIIDTGAARTELHETRAMGEGYSGEAVTLEVRVGGISFPEREVAIVDQDARTWAFPTPIAGVIGADVLRHLVLEAQFEPCRLRVGPPSRPPAGAPPAAVLPLTWIEGRPTVRAAVADDRSALAGPMTPATGLDAAVRLSPSAAEVSGAAEPGKLGPYGSARAELRALSFAGVLFERLPAGLLAEGDAARLGAVGPAVLARWRLRFDFPAGRLELYPPDAP